MPDLPTGNPEQFYQGAPVLSVPDVAATAVFYRTMLGFRSDAGAESPDYTVVWRDNAAVRLARGDRGPTGSSERFSHGSTVLSVPDVAATAVFYRTMLGFRSDAGAESPDYTVVWRDNAAV